MARGIEETPDNLVNWNDGIIYNLYNTKGSGIPLFVLISPDGYIIDKWYGYGDGAITNQLKGKIE